MQEKVGMADPARSEQNGQGWGQSYHWSPQDRLCRARGAVRERGALDSWLEPPCVLTETERAWACTWKTSGFSLATGLFKGRGSELRQEVLWVRDTGALSSTCECLSLGAEVASILCALNAEHKAQGRQVDRQISALLKVAGAAGSEEGAAALTLLSLWDK